MPTQKIGKGSKTIKVNGPERSKLRQGRNSYNGRSVRGYILTYSRLYKENILLALDSQQGKGEGGT